MDNPWTTFRLASGERLASEKRFVFMALANLSYLDNLFWATPYAHMRACGYLSFRYDRLDRLAKHVKSLTNFVANLFGCGSTRLARCGKGPSKSRAVAGTRYCWISLYPDFFIGKVIRFQSVSYDLAAWIAGRGFDTRQMENVFLTSDRHQETETPS